MLRHQARERDFEPAGGGCSETIGAVERHVERFIGPISGVFHEIVSDLVHIDVHVVPAGEGRHFHALVTSGMSDRPMHLPRELRRKVPQYAELMILLPPTWPLDQESWNDERHYWPIRQLKILARLPHEYETWLSHWHTVPNGDPAEPFAEDTAFCGVLLTPPIVFPSEFRTFRTDDGRTVEIFAVVPLLPDELATKVQYGVEALLPGFEARGVSELFNPRRRSVL